jgi:hypothetical protein
MRKERIPDAHWMGWVIHKAGMNAGHNCQVNYAKKFDRGDKDSELKFVSAV